MKKLISLESSLSHSSLHFILSHQILLVELRQHCVGIAVLMHRLGTQSNVSSTKANNVCRYTVMITAEDWRNRCSWIGKLGVEGNPHHRLHKVC